MTDWTQYGVREPFQRGNLAWHRQTHMTHKGPKTTLTSCIICHCDSELGIAQIMVGNGSKATVDLNQVVAR